MPLSKKRKKEGKPRSRDRREAANVPAPPEDAASGGLLTRMRGGFQSMTGTSVKKESRLSKIITWAIVLLAAYFVARRFGIIP